MSEKREISALVHLLEDPDENIYIHIKDKLMEIGPECIPLLEKASFEEQLGKLFNDRAKDLIHEIGFKKLIEKHQDWVNIPASLFNGVMEIDQYFFPNTTLNYINHEINQMIEDISIQLTNSMSPVEKVMIINNVLFDTYKIYGDKENYHLAENSSLGNLIKNKKGNPLTISLLYIEIASRLNIPIKGINLPNHFIVGYINENAFGEFKQQSEYHRNDVLFYINAFSKGVILQHVDLEDFLAEIKLDNNEKYVTPCGNKDISKRILTNLIYSYKDSNIKYIKKDLEGIIKLYN
jgi:hypothetical protein